MRKCVIIMNPESGKKKKLTSYNLFYDMLRKHGYDTEIIFTKKKGDATEIVQTLDYKETDLVISAGGDGTLNEVVTGNMRREQKLLIANLPMGTTNDVGNMYGYTKSIEKNLELLLTGKPKKIDVCYIDDTAFVYVACLGDYIDMAYNTPRELKKKYGTNMTNINYMVRSGKLIPYGGITQRDLQAFSYNLYGDMLFDISDIKNEKGIKHLEKLQSKHIIKENKMLIILITMILNLNL